MPPRPPGRPAPPPRPAVAPTAAQSDGRLRKVEEVFIAALEIPNAQARAAYLAGACGDDAALRAEVEELLAADAAQPDFLQGAADDAFKAEEAGETIGNYKLREQIGEGGFGTVWVADQEMPVRRRVALKIIKLGMDTKEVIARFEQERQALAMMDHPNIARVLDAGATDKGRPYFVMELVRGVKITEYCDDQQLSTQERLALFITVCQAVQHAHQKGIIHRDLKPSNILVTINDGVAVPKVIDFGVAKATHGRLTDHTVYTQFSQMIGTPLYMSPEQAEMTSLDIDTRSDIYSLGVLLYELLTGHTPIDTETMRAAGMDEIRRIIREVDPPRPSMRVKTFDGAEMTTAAKRRHTEPAKLHGTLRGDLDWIVMKCIEKDRKRRYDTANGLALDLQRHLANEVVVARPPTTGYLLGKLIRRHRLAFAAGAAIIASLVLGIAAATWMYFRESDARKRATDAEKKTAETLAQVTTERDAKEQARKNAEDISKFLTEVFQSPDPSRDGRTITVAETLDKAVKKLDADLVTHPRQQVNLQATLGETYRALGLPRQAIPLLEKALDTHLKYCGAERECTLAAMNNLANSYDDAGRRGDAFKLREEVLPLSRKVNGPEHRVTLMAMSNLANSYSDANRKDEALKLREEVLALSRKVNGPEHPDVLTVMQNLALSYGIAGRLDEALKMQEEVLTLKRKVLGSEHPDTLGAMSNLALSYDAAERQDEALKLRVEVLTLSRKVNGPEHSDTLDAMHNLAISYDAAKRKEEALKLKEEVLALRRKVNGPEHPVTLTAMNNLAVSYDDTGRRDRALKLREEMLTLRRKVLGPKHPDTLDAMNALAVSYDEAGRKDEAAKLRAELEALKEKK